jgi:hypothetical protein
MRLRNILVAAIHQFEKAATKDIRLIVDIDPVGIL